MKLNRDSLIKQLGEELNGRFNQAEIKFHENGQNEVGACLYVDFNDSLSNTLAVYPSRKKDYIIITNFRYLESDRIKAETRWSRSKRVSDMTDLVGFFESCHKRMSEEMKKSDDELRRSLMDAGTPQSDIEMVLARRI